VVSPVGPAGAAGVLAAGAARTGVGRLLGSFAYGPGVLDLAGAVLAALAVVAMAVALARPRTGDAQSRIRREGIAIVMVVDRSGSMNARDLVPDDRRVNRLHVVKALFKQFVLGDAEGGDVPAEIGRGRPDDLIGLVAFARYADGLCPLTLDHGNLVNIVEQLEIVSEQAEDGTALGEGLALAVQRLHEHRSRSKVAILLTDGVSNVGQITPQQAARLASEEGVKVYCIGAGTKGVAPVPQLHPFTGETIFAAMPVEIDEGTLKVIASETGGRYFRADNAEALAGIYRQIDQLERSKITEHRFTEYEEWFGVFVAGALCLLGAAALLGGTFFRRLP